MANPSWLSRVRSQVRAEDYVGEDTVHHAEIIREGFASKAKRFLRQVPIAADVVAMYFCLLDARTPTWVKATVGAALAYFILPLDAIPDILPLVGLSDDVGVLTAAVTAVSSHLTDEHRQKAREWMEVEEIAPR